MVNWMLVLPLLIFMAIPVTISILLIIRIVLGTRYEVETVNILKGKTDHKYEVVKKIENPEKLFKDSYVWYKRPYHYFFRGIRKKYLRVLVESKPIDYVISLEHPSVCWIVFNSNAIKKSFESIQFGETSKVNFKQLLLFGFIVIIIIIVYSWWSGGQR